MVKVEHAARSVQLKQKEKLEIAAGDTAMVKEAVTDHFYKYYRTKEFVCDNTPLWKLTQALSEAYNVNIVIENPALKDLPIDVTFYNETLDQILKVMVDTYPEYNITVDRKDSIIILK